MTIEIDKEIGKDDIVWARYFVITKEDKFELIHIFSRKESELNINYVLRKFRLIEGTYGNQKPKKIVQSVIIKLIMKI